MLVVLNQYSASLNKLEHSSIVISFASLQQWGNWRIDVIKRQNGGLTNPGYLNFSWNLSWNDCLEGGLMPICCQLSYCIMLWIKRKILDNYESKISSKIHRQANVSFTILTWKSADYELTIWYVKSICVFDILDVSITTVKESIRNKTR